MSFEEVIEKYEEELSKADYEIIKTNKLGWVAIMYEYYMYDDPVLQFETPDKMEEWILLRSNE